MKRILALIIIVTFLMPITTFAHYDVPSYLRIGMFYGSSAKNEAVVTTESGFYIGSYTGTTFTEISQTIYKEVTVTFNDNTITVKNNDGQIIHTAEAETGVGIFPTKGGMDRRLKISGEEYRGGLDFKKVNGKNVITNVVFMNNYLYGVISREMSPSWHIEALKAQAVCARNYAINNLNKHKEYGFDLCNTVCCQAYAGTRFETDNSYAPVDDTSNQILTYNSKPAELYYSSSMGSRTEDVKNVWGSNAPYLVSVDNSYEDTENVTNGVWSGSITSDEATTIMRNKGYDVGIVTNIEALEYTDNGRVLKLKVTGSLGSKTFEREACRTIFNTVTKSQAYTVKGNGEGTKVVPSIAITDGKNNSSLKINEIVLLSSGGRTTLKDFDLFITNGTVQKKYNIKASAGNGVNTAFNFEGTGWGHSVGMSQYGAKGMAEAGFSYLDILLHYFPGTNLENAY